MNAKVEAMLNEFIATTQPNPVGNGRVLTLGKDAWVLLHACAVHGERVWLKEVRTLLNFRQGQGSKAMEYLCALADKHGVVLQLTPKQIVKGLGMTTARLKKWYPRFGFEPNGEWMYRNPKGGQ
jgi:hypothetical protein